jgi:hypothetical protein
MERSVYGSMELLKYTVRGGPDGLGDTHLSWRDMMRVPSSRHKRGSAVTWTTTAKALMMAAVLGLTLGLLVFPMSGGASRSRGTAEIAPPGIDANHAGDYSADPNSGTTLVTPPGSDLSDPVLAPPTDTWPDHQLLTGAQYPPSVAQVSDTWWMGTVNGWHVMVFVGSDATALGQGEIIVRKVSLDEETSVPDAFYPTPHQDGPLQLTAAQNNVLSLSGTDGATFSFDVSTNGLTQTGGCLQAFCP